MNTERGWKDEKELVKALCRGDAQAFTGLVDRYHASLVRLAQVWIAPRDGAEEVVQDTWLAVIEGIDRFEGRSSLKTWIVRILINKARRRAARDGRQINLGSLNLADEEDGSAPVDSALFTWIGRFRTAPAWWAEATPERLVAQAEAVEQIEDTIAGLPPGQRAVVLMRDVEGFSSTEVCNILEISETNQRVLLHRARSKLRKALEYYVEGGTKPR